MRNNSGPLQRRPSLLRLRFTLRLLLAAVTVFCVWLAIRVNRTERQRRAVAFHAVRSTNMVYDYERDAVPSGLESRSSPVPQWLLRRLGTDFFHTVVKVEVHDCDQLRDLEAFPGLTDVETTGNGINDHDIRCLSRLRKQLRTFVAHSSAQSDLTDNSLQWLGEMPHLEELQIGGRFSGEGISALAKSRSLRRVTLIGCEGSDRSLRLLGEMCQLEVLELCGHFSAEGLAELAKSRSLRVLTLSDCAGSYASLKSLGQMPRLEALSLHGHFSAEGLSELAKSLSLREVSIIGCDESVTSAAAEPFRATRRIEHLSLRKWPRPLPTVFVSGPSLPTHSDESDGGLIDEW